MPLRAGYIGISRGLDLSYMQRALEVSAQAIGLSNPNPPVGAVLVRDDEIISEGFTGPPGSPHAEASAISKAGDLANGSSLYVTLEPCSHFGRTGPCVQTIISAGIKKVHASLIDPDPRVNGLGIDILREAGVEVVVGEMGDKAQKVMEPHVKLMETGLPLVTVKFAASLDGKIATVSGESQWITGEEARGVAHSMRSVTDSIMVGIGTVLADNPRLTARYNQSSDVRQPIRIIVDSNSRTPTDSAMFSEEGQTFIATLKTAKEADWPSNVTNLRIGDDAGKVDLLALLEDLAEIPVSSVLVEGGSQLIGSLFDLHLVDKVAAFIAPVIIGGDESLSAVGGEGAFMMKQISRLSNVTVENVGDDFLITGDVNY